MPQSYQSWNQRRVFRYVERAFKPATSAFMPTLDTLLAGNLPGPFKHPRFRYHARHRLLRIETRDPL
jgi:hypothetical protein